MIKPLTGWQKVVAYGSLLAILGCTALGLAMIWLVLNEPAV